MAHIDQVKPNQTNFSFTVPIKLDRNNCMLWKSQVLPAIRGNNLETLITGAQVTPDKYIVVVDDEENYETNENP